MTSSVGESQVNPKRVNSAKHRISIVDNCVDHEKMWSLSLLFFYRYSENVLANGSKTFWGCVHI